MNFSVSVCSIATLIILLVSNAFADTVDFCHLYRNGKLIADFLSTNAPVSVELDTLREGDVFSFSHFSDNKWTHNKIIRLLREDNTLLTEITSYEADEFAPVLFNGAALQKYFERYPEKSVSLIYGELYPEKATYYLDTMIVFRLKGKERQKE